MKPLANFRNLPVKARLAIVMFGMAGLLSAGIAILSGGVNQSERLVLLVLLGATTAHIKIKLSETSSLSLLTSVIMLTMMMEGVVGALAVGVTGVTVQAFLPSRKFVVHRFVFNAAMVVLAIQAASIPYYLVVSQQLVFAVLGHVLAIAAASVTYYLGNSLAVSLIVGLTECKSVVRVWSDHFLVAAPSFLSSGLLSLVVVEVLAKTILGAAILLPLLYFSYRSLQKAGSLATSASR